MIQRRRMLTLLCAVAIILALAAGCGSKVEPNSRGENQENAGENSEKQQSKQDKQKNNEKENEEKTDTDGDKVETRVFKDSLDREVTIPVKPQRVVATSFIGELLSLGYKPVGASEQLLRFYTEEDIAGITSIGSDASNKEAMIALDPDLIIASARTAPDEIEAMSKIAPVVAVPFFGEQLQSLHIAADILGLQKEEEAWLAQYNERVTKLQEKVKPIFKENESGIVIQFAQKALYTYATRVFPTVYDVLGLTPPEKLQELQKDKEFTGVVALSEESLLEFTADRIFVIVNDEESIQVFEETKKGAIWSRIPAVKNNQVYVIDKRLSISDVSTLDWALDEVDRLLFEQK